MEKKILIVLMAALLAGCRTPEPVTVVREVTNVRDSVIYNIVDSIVYIPMEVYVNNTPADSSHLETSLAASDAWTDTDGVLHHSLSNKQALQREVIKEVRYVTRDSIQRIPEPYPVEVEKELNWIQKTLMYSGAAAILLLMAIVIVRIKNKIASVR